MEAVRTSSSTPPRSSARACGACAKARRSPTSFRPISAPARPLRSTCRTPKRIADETTWFTEHVRYAIAVPLRSGFFVRKEIHGEGRAHHIRGCRQRDSARCPLSRAARQRARGRGLHGRQDEEEPDQDAGGRPGHGRDVALRPRERPPHLPPPRYERAFRAASAATRKSAVPPTLIVCTTAHGGLPACTPGLDRAAVLRQPPEAPRE